METRLVDILRATTAMQAAAHAFHATGDVIELDAMRECMSEISGALRELQLATDYAARMRREASKRKGPKP